MELVKQYCRQLYCFTNSISPSARHVVVLYLIEFTYRQIFLLFSTTLVCLSPNTLTKFHGEPFRWGVKYMGGKICDFRPKSRSFSVRYDTTDH